MNRRTMLRHTVLGLSGLAAAKAIEAPAPAVVPPATSPVAPLGRLQRFPRMLQEYYVARVRELDAASGRKLAELDSATKARAYIEEARAKIQTSFGPFPERTPLNARVTGTIERETYRIEKLIFESRPGFLITGNLYLPRRPGRLPAVLGTCGHSALGKAAPPYQSFAQGLARQGYVVLIFDPLGQGERVQSYKADGSLRYDRMGVPEHHQCGNQQALVGEFLGAWMIWDGIRALDYLLLRPEVDPWHVGLTGNSGGGTQATWLCALEPRFTMAAPGCFVTTFLRNLENELPSDPEQCPPGVLAAGLDQADFLAAFAPKPLMLLAQEADFFDIRGTESAYARLRRLYGLCGAEDQIQLHVGGDSHGFSRGNREAMYGWFNRITGGDPFAKEPELKLEEEPALWCTPHGSVAELKSRSIFSFTAEKSRALAASRGQVTGEELTAAVRECLRLPRTIPVPDYRILRPLTERGYPRKFATPYFLEHEPGTGPLVYLLTGRPVFSRPRLEKKVVLYVSHRSADQELRGSPWLRDYFGRLPDSAWCTCDVRGIGESEPNTTDEPFESPFGPDYFYASHGLMLGEPLLGRRTLDVLVTIEWLADRGATEIELVADGYGTVPATLAAVLSNRVGRVTLKNAFPSYAALAENAQYDAPLSLMPSGVLQHFDLPDCHRTLGARVQFL